MADSASNINPDWTPGKSTRSSTVGLRSVRRQPAKRSRARLVAQVPPFDDEDSTIEVQSRRDLSSSSPNPSTAPSTVLDAGNDSKATRPPEKHSQNEQRDSSPVIESSLYGGSRSNSPQAPLPENRVDTPRQDDSTLSRCSTPQTSLVGASGALNMSRLSTLSAPSSGQQQPSSARPPNTRGSPLFVSTPPPHSLPTMAPTAGAEKRSNDTNGHHERRVRPRPDFRRPESPEHPRGLNNPPMVPSNSDLSERLRSELTAMGVDTSPPPSSTYRRIDMLRDACSWNDEFFLLAHFILSNSTPSPKWDVLGPLFLSPKHLQALRSLSEILCRDINLSTELCTLFMTFPYHTTAMTENASCASHPRLDSVRAFLEVFDAGFSKLKANTIQRGFPPAPIELWSALELPSPVMQKALFFHLHSGQAASSHIFWEGLRLFERELEESGEMFTDNGIRLDPLPWGVVFQWSENYSKLQGTSSYSAAVQAPTADHLGSLTPILQHGDTHMASQLSATPARRSITSPSLSMSSTLILQDPMVQGSASPLVVEQTASARQPRQTAEPAQRFTGTVPSCAGPALTTAKYEFIEDFVVLQECVHADSDSIRWNVKISSDHWARRLTPVPTTGPTSSRESGASNGNVQFRLRSVVVNARGRQPFIPTVSDFYDQTSKWPLLVSVMINKDPNIVLRRGTDGGADLATDVTDLLKEGDNEVEVNTSFLLERTPLQSMYLMAVEIVCMADHDQIKAMPTRIPAADIIEAITSSLKSTEGRPEDDDVVTSQPAVSIDLIDPLTSTIWRRPVRGRDCQHRECFDLEAFLASRADVVDQESLTAPNRWNCPICNGDARPNSLVIDEFLMDVRTTLARNHQMQARSILVKEDGTWEPNLGPSTSEDHPRGTPPSTGAIATEVTDER